MAKDIVTVQDSSFIVSHIVAIVEGDDVELYNFKKAKDGENVCYLLFVNGHYVRLNMTRRNAIERIYGIDANEVFLS